MPESASENICLVRYRYLYPTSADGCDVSAGKERFDAVIRCFEVIGFKPQVTQFVLIHAPGFRNFLR